MILFAFHLGQLSSAETIVSQKCASLLVSQYESDLYFGGAIYSPIMMFNGQPRIANWRFLDFFANPATGQDHRVLRTEQRLDPNSDIGFLPTPAELQSAQLSYQFSTGLSAFVEGFSRRGSLEEMQQMKKNDQAMVNHFLGSQRLGYSFTTESSDPGAKFSSFIRIFDGSDYSALGFSDGPKVQSSFLLPTEISFLKAGVKTDFFNNFRKQGFQIFQIGKYVLKKEMTPRQRAHARRKHMNWILENYLDPATTLSDKVIYIINVDSLAHEETYNKEFGTQRADPELFDPPIAPPEAVLYVDQQTLRRHLEKYR